MLIYLEPPLFHTPVRIAEISWRLIKNGGNHLNSPFFLTLFLTQFLAPFTV